jgi:hypothetical protein
MMSHTQPKISRTEFFRLSFLSRWKIFCLFFIPLILLISASYASTTTQQPEAIAIAGISIDTPAENIQKILQAQGYTQINESLYTKQEHSQNGRTAVFRIEIEDNATFRQITYFRSLGGGRLKSPAVHDTPIPATEMDMAQQLYQVICPDISQQIHEDRACEPLTPSQAKLGNGQWIQKDSFAVLLDATYANTTIGIKDQKKQR